MPKLKEPRICSVDGCTNQHHAKGYCRQHYQVNLLRKPPKPPKPIVPCSVEGCTVDARTAGMCQRHYVNMRRHGSVLAPSVRPGRNASTTPLEFLQSIVVRVTETGCWETETWGARYRTLWVKGEKWVGHRWAWVHIAGLPLKRWPKEQLDHICANPACIRPAHLQVVTQAENNRLREEREQLRAEGKTWPIPNEPRTELERQATEVISPQLLATSVE